MIRFYWLVLIAFCASLSGCDQATLMKKFTPPEDEATAKKCVELLRQRQFDQIERELDPSVVDSDTRDKLAQLAELIPDENPESIKVVGITLNRGQDSSTSNITLEYEFPSEWLLVNVLTQRKGGTSTVLGLHGTPMADSLENANRFTLVGKDASQYLTLIVALGSLSFSIYVFVLCIRSTDIKPKWLWAVIVLVGVSRFTVNWTTGQTAFTPLAIQIPCLMATRPFYGPWTVGAYFPLGAILFLNKRWKMKITGESIPRSVDGPEGNAATPP